MSYQDHLHQFTLQIEKAHETLIGLLEDADDNIAGDVHWLMRELRII